MQRNSSPWQPTLSHRRSSGVASLCSMVHCMLSSPRHCRLPIYCACCVGDWLASYLASWLVPFVLLSASTDKATRCRSGRQARESGTVGEGGREGEREKEGHVMSGNRGQTMQDAPFLPARMHTHTPECSGVAASGLLPSRGRPRSRSVGTHCLPFYCAVYVQNGTYTRTRPPSIPLFSLSLPVSDEGERANQHLCRPGNAARDIAR